MYLDGDGGTHGVHGRTQANDASSVQRGIVVLDSKRLVRDGCHKVAKGDRDGRGAITWHEPAILRLYRHIREERWDLLATILFSCVISIHPFPILPIEKKNVDPSFALTVLKLPGMEA